MGAPASMPSFAGLDMGLPGQKLIALAYIGLFYTLAVIVVLLLWYQLWVKNLGGKLRKTLIRTVEIPIERAVPGVNRLFYTTRSPAILLEFFSGMFSKFKKEYWTQQCGQDAYLYLVI